MVQYSHLGMYQWWVPPPSPYCPFCWIKFQQETRFGEMSKLDNEFKKRQLSMMLCPMQTLRFPHWRNKKLEVLIWTRIKINTKHRFFSSLAKIRSHYTGAQTLVLCIIPAIEKEIPASIMFRQKLPTQASLLYLHICPQLHSFCTVCCPHPWAREQIKSQQKATLRSQCFANRAQSAIIRT